MNTDFWVEHLKKQVSATWTNGILKKLDVARDKVTLEEIGQIDMDFIDEVRGAGDGAR